MTIFSSLLQNTSDPQSLSVLFVPMPVPVPVKVVIEVTVVVPASVVVVVVVVVYASMPVAVAVPVVHDGQGVQAPNPGQESDHNIHPVHPRPAFSLFFSTREREGEA